MSRLDDIIKRTKGNKSSNEVDTQTDSRTDKIINQLKPSTENNETESRLDRIIKKVGTSTYKPDGTALNSFLADYEGFSKSASSDYSSINYNSASSTSELYKEKAWNLRSKIEEIEALYNLNRQNLTTEEMKLKNYITKARSYIDEVVNSYSQASKFYSQFDTEDAYKEWEKTQAEIKEHEMMANSEDGIKGWEKYLEDSAKAEEEAKAAEEDKPWWEKIGEYLGNTTDTTLPTGTTSQVIYDLKEDVSYARPKEDWTEEQQRIFGYMYMSDPEKAYEYAIATNNSNAKAKEEAQLKEIQDSATSSFWSGAGHTLGAIATAPLGLADYLYDLALANAGRDIAPDGNISPFEYSQAVTSGISTHLNENYGTIDESVPIFGGKGWGDVYGLGTSMAQSAVSGLTLGSGGTLISYFGQGAAAGVDDALSRGATEEQAVLYGASLGAFEGIAESIGIDNLFKLGSSSTLKGLIKNVVKQAGAEGMEEGLTSILGNIADAWIMQDKSNFNILLDQYMSEGMSETDAKRKVFWDSIEGIAYDTIGGAVSGAGHAGVFSGVSTAYQNAVTKNKYSDQVENLLTEAASIEGAGKTVDKYVDKYGKKGELSGWNINHLLEITDTNKVKSAIEAKLTSLGEKGDVSQLADILTKQVKGIELSKKEQKTLDSSTYGKKLTESLDSDKIKERERNNVWAKAIRASASDTKKVKSAIEARLNSLDASGDVSQLADILTKYVQGTELSEKEQKILDSSTYGSRMADILNPDNIKARENDNAWAKGIGTRKLNASVYNKNVYDIINEARRNANASANTEGVQNLSENAPQQEADAKITIEKDGEKLEVKLDKIESIENGKMTVKLEGGETVNADEVDFGGSGIGLVYQAAKDMSTRVGGFNIDTANVFVKGFDPGSGLSAAEYVHGFSDAYRFGKLGYPASELASGVYTSKLSEEQRNNAYNFGKAFGNEEVTKKSANIVNTVTKNDENISKNDSKKKKGKLHFDEAKYGKNFNKLNKRQRASLEGLRVVAEALGLDIHIFESDVVDGVRQGENGWYNPSTREIGIDLYAGVKGDSLMLFTGSHELTHHIREVAPDKFKIFADALLEEYAKNGHSVEALIKAKMEFLEEKGRLEGRTEEEAYDLAYEEVVADSCEAMLVDSNAIEALSRKIHEQDKGLWQTIKNFIAKLVAKIKAAYKGLNPDSSEANYVRDMVDSAERLQKLWVDALLEASEVSNEQTLTENGIVVDSKTDSASLMSVRDVLSHEDRQKVSKALADRFDVTQTEAMDWLKAETSLASLILNPKYSQYLDYTADANEEAIKSNSDYPQGTVDFSNICKKRRAFTEVMNRVLRNFPNHVFEATDLAKIRTIMEEEGMEVACAICYVEDRRQLDSVVAQNFIDSLALYRNGSKTKPDGTPFNANQLKAFKLIEGDTYTPSIYELISLEGRNSLKAKNPAMEEAWVKFNNARGMQSVRLLLNDAEYKRQILKYSPTVVKRKNDLGGLRIYSFSDAEMFHLIDIIQVITDSATVGLSLQGYTKVNEYAKAVKDTGEKLNRSLIPKGDLGYHIEDGRVVLDFDTVEGIDINHPDFFDNIDNPNIGNIVIGINATQIKAAMTSKFIDQIIPFHTGQSNEVLGEKGIASWDNYKDFQSERDAKTKKKSSHQINIYTEVINAAEAEGHPITNKVEFVNKFLEVCRENNLIPRFSDFLDVNENGEYIYTEGYHKFLVDFKTFDQNTGEYLPQMPVKPIFDNEYITKLLEDYVKSQKVKDAELTKAMPKVLDRITNEIVKPKNSDVKYSLRVKRTNGTEIIANPYETTREQTLEYMRMSRKGQLENYTYFPVSSDTSKTIIATLKNAGIDIENRPLAMQADKARQSQIDAKPIHKNGFTIRYHAMSAEKILEVIDNLDEAVAIIHQRNRTATKTINGEKQIVGSPDNFAVFVALEDGKEYVAVIEFDAEIKNKYIFEDGKGDKYHTTVTVFEPDVEREGVAFDYIEYLLLREDNQELDIIKENPKSEAAIRQTEATAPEKEFSNNSISQSPNSVKRKFSDRDSTGNTLSKKQQEFFKDSKVRDEDGNLLVVYHGSPNKFTTFRQGVADGWGRGIYFTDNREEASTYGNNVVEVYLNIKNPYNADAMSYDEIGAENTKAYRDFDKQKWKKWYAEYDSYEEYKADGMGVDLYEIYTEEVEVFNKILRELGYDGIIAYGSNNINGFEIVAFSENQPKLTSNKNPTESKDIRYSDRASKKASYVPTFYSHMGKVIDGIRLEKMGAGGVVSYLKGKGVKDEEIKWSGIEVFLEGKKSVTKAELQEFVAGSQLQIEEEMSDNEEYTRWSQYKLDGGTNYRELVFEMPNSTYSNRAMRGHWGEEGEGILAHARIQDFNVNGKKMLFIEEIQSDWHNEGREKGYTTKEYEDAYAVYDKLAEDYANKRKAFNQYVRSGDFRTDPDDVSKKKFDWLRMKMDTAEKRMQQAERDIEALKEKGMGDVPDAPFRNNYHEYVLKRLLRMAAEEGYDSIGWTTADIQSKRWSEDYAEAYRIEYDQDMPKFLRKYGKKWGTTVGKSSIDGDTEIWSMDISDSMKESVLTEGQPLYQDRNPDSFSNRSLLANALETAAQNDIEREKLKQYKEKISLINAEEQKLHELREKIKELSFKKGPRDTEAIKSLQFEANQAANRINTYDRQLLNLESTKALKGVLEREKAQARKRAEQKGKEALARYREKAAETQRELMTRYQESRKRGIESRNKTAMKHKIKNVVSDLNKLLLNPTKDQHVPIGLQKVVAEALDLINMDTMNAEERVAYYNDLISKATDPDEIEMLTKKRDFFEYRDANFKEKITALKNAYAEFKESDDPLIRNAHNDAIEDLIKSTADEVGNKSLKDMSLEQLEKVYDMYKAILATVRNSNKMFKEGRQATVTENSEAVKTEVKEVGGHKDRVNKLTKGIKGFAWNLLKPIYALRAIGSNTLTKLYENVRAGEDTYAVDISEAREFFQDKTKKYHYDSWDFKKRYNFKDSTGTEFSLSLEQIMSLYAYSKREQADRHLEVGGFVFDDSIEVTEKKLGIPIKYEVNDANPYRLKKEELIAVTSALTKDQMGFIDEMQTYLSEVMGAKGNEVSLAMYDIKLYNEKNYFPLKTSRYFREYNPEQSGNPMLRNSGFSKKTVPKAGNPIVLSNFMDVWTSHVNDMSMYHSFVLALEDFMRVYNYSSTAGGYDSVQQYIKNAYGAQANQYIEKLMQDINGGVVSGNIHNGMLKMFSKFKKATVGASLSTIVQQPTAVIRAMSEINPVYFVGVPFKDGHRKTWEEIKKYAPVAIIKEMGGFDVGSGRQAKDYIGAQKKGILGKIDDAFMWGATKADELGWNIIWKAVKREVASKQKLKPGTEEFYKACGKRFTDVVTLTQVYDSVFSRSGIMRDKGDLNKFATSFMGEPTTSLNMIFGAVLDAKRGGSKAKAAGKIASVYASIVGAAAMASIIYALRDDDEDESYLEKYAEAFGGKLSSEVWMHNMVPYIRDIASIIEGWDVERPDMSIFADIKSSFDKLYKVNEDGEYEWNIDFSDPKAVYSAIENFGGSVASAFGVPLKNILRDTRSIFNGIDDIFDDIQPSGVGDAFISGWTGEEKSKTDSIYEAILNGDNGKLEVYKKSYKTEDAYETAVRKALRENDPRINEAARARYDGDISEYTRIAKEIIGECNFSQDTVVGAINSAITAIKNSESTDTDSNDDKDEATSIYAASDISSAFERGDTALAKSIIADLVKTKIANGKTEKEAKSSLRSSLTSYWKPQYKEAYSSGNASEMARIRKILYSSGLYGTADEVVKACQNWLKD